MDLFYLIVGLGNPGSEYELTRHNLGFMVVNHIASVYKCSFRKYRYFSLAKFQLDEHNIFLMKPSLFMNRSGLAVSMGVPRFEIDLSRLLVVVDDFNLPFGKLRIRSRGSAGGHNGLQSIIDALNTDRFARLRIGIGSENVQDGVVDYVLSPFNEEEVNQLDSIIESASQCAIHFVKFGIASAMNKFN